MQVLLSPLLRHCAGNSCVRSGPQFCSFFTWRHPPHSLIPFRDYLCWAKRRKTFQPQTSCFRLSVTELPRLNYLVRFSVHGGHDGHGIFDRDSLAVGKDHLHKENTCFLLPEITLFFWKPSRAAHSKVSAWRVSYQQIPRAKLCVCV